MSVQRVDVKGTPYWRASIGAGVPARYFNIRRFGAKAAKAQATEAHDTLIKQYRPNGLGRRRGVPTCATPWGIPGLHFIRDPRNGLWNLRVEVCLNGTWTWRSRAIRKWGIQGALDWAINLRIKHGARPPTKAELRICKRRIKTENVKPWS